MVVFLDDGHDMDNVPYFVIVTSLHEHVLILNSLEVPLRRWRQEEDEFKVVHKKTEFQASLGYIRSCSKHLKQGRRDGRVLLPSLRTHPWELSALTVCSLTSTSM